MTVLPLLEANTCTKTRKITATEYSECTCTSNSIHLEILEMSNFLFQENLQSLIKMKPSFLHLGEKGVMMLCRYMSTAEGYKFLMDANYTLNELKKWQAVS